MKLLLKTILLLMMLTMTSYARDTLTIQNIFPFQNKHVHASSIVQAANGDFLACWFHGSGERTANDVKVLGARLKKGAKAWSAVFDMADTPDIPDCNPVLYIDARERLWIFWIVVQANRWEYSILKYRRADEYQSNGAPFWNKEDIILLKPGEHMAAVFERDKKHFGFFESMWAEYARPYSAQLIEAAKDPVKRQRGWMTRNHPLTLSDGRILLPLYSDGFNASLMAISDDAGDTWRAGTIINGFGPIQPTIVEKRDGSLVAYLRDSGIMPPRVMQSTSTDRGESWTFAIDTKINNPGSSLEVIKLRSGNWLMVYNDQEDGRHSLTAALSQDEGQSWQWQKKIAYDATKRQSYSYPSVIEGRNNMIHITYSYSNRSEKTIHHATFSESWLKE